MASSRAGKRAARSSALIAWFSGGGRAVRPSGGQRTSSRETSHSRSAAAGSSACGRTPFSASGSVVGSGFVVVLEIPSAGSGDERGRGEQHGGGGPLFGGLPVVVVEDLLCCGAGLVALQAGADAAGHEGVRGDAVGRPTLRRFDGEQDVGGLRLAVRRPFLVVPPFEHDVVEDDR
jgi:hypothetical protein